MSLNLGRPFLLSIFKQQRIYPVLSVTFHSLAKPRTLAKTLQIVGLQSGPKFCCVRSSASFVNINMEGPIWKPPVPAKAGDKLKDIATPALIVDLDVMEYNMKQMTISMLKYPNVAVRPHAKAHKCPPIGKIQMEQQGCVGMCTQTLTETEAMVYGGGPTDILLSNQCIGKDKIRRLAALVKVGANISVCVDDADNIREMSEVAADLGVNLDLVVEVNVGQNRCGVEPGPAAAVLAKMIQELPNIRFKGVQFYMGLNQHVRTDPERQAATDKVVELSKMSLQGLTDAGIACTYVTGGGTGTYLYEAASGIFTEVQPGSYIFMDADYWLNKGNNNEEHFEFFRHSLFVLTTVQSVSGTERAVGDAGLKAVSFDSGPPLIAGHLGVSYGNGGDEHGIITPANNFKVGDILKLIPGHCDPTVNMYDYIIAVRGDVVEAVWPVLGRGPGV